VASPGPAYSALQSRSAWQRRKAFGILVICIHGEDAQAASPGVSVPARRLQQCTALP
jgi:hypothetical protein